MTRARRKGATAPLCACGCGERVTWNKKRWEWRAYVVGHRFPDLGPAPLCACGCGGSVRRVGRRWLRWLKGHHTRKHGFEPRAAKVNERLLRVYGLQRAAYDALLRAQGGRCAVCRSDEPGNGRNTARAMWCVDHDHRTGKVRGLLCRGCNAGIGNLRDDPDILDAAAAYLRRNR